MEGFTTLVNLQKLYLQKNCIQKLEGLENCRRLEELNLSSQRLPPRASLTYDEYSLAAIATTLYRLDLAEN